MLTSLSAILRDEAVTDGVHLPFVEVAKLPAKPLQMPGERTRSINMRQVRLLSQGLYTMSLSSSFSIMCNKADVQKRSSLLRCYEYHKCRSSSHLKPNLHYSEPRVRNSGCITNPSPPPSQNQIINHQLQIPASSSSFVTSSQDREYFCVLKETKCAANDAITRCHRRPTPHSSQSLCCNNA